jgi:hypothetical protein
VRFFFAFLAADECNGDVTTVTFLLLRSEDCVERGKQTRGLWFGFSWSPLQLGFGSVLCKHV